MKIVPLLVILYIALIGIMIFDNISGSGWNANPYTNTTSTNNPKDAGIWNLFTNPTNWGTNVFVTLITVTFLSVAAAIFVTYLTKSDIAMVTPLFAVLINAGVLPIMAIYQVVYREILRMTCTGVFNVGTLLASCTTGTGTTAILLSALIVGPIAVAWIMACIEWWTQRPTS